ncbi:hypothetical protein Gotur_030922 [Gossypium turneri]
MLNAKRQMAITFVEPCLSVFTMNLTKWNIGSSLSYIINGGYSKVLKNNKNSLKPNTVVQIWLFRVQQVFVFCIGMGWDIVKEEEIYFEIVATPQ